MELELELSTVTVAVVYGAQERRVHIASEEEFTQMVRVAVSWYPGDCSRQVYVFNQRVSTPGLWISVSFDLGDVFVYLGKGSRIHSR